MDEYFDELFYTWYEEPRYHDIMVQVGIAKDLIADARNDENAEAIDDALEALERAEGI